MDAGTIILIIGIIFFLGIGSVIAFVILSRLRWKYEVQIIGDATGSGTPIIAKFDKARAVGFGDGGEEIFILKKTKKYKVGYGNRLGVKKGRPIIGWIIGKDGYWYNFKFGNFDKKLLELGVIPTSMNMRYATASVRKGIEVKYGDKSWMEKYGPIMYFGLFVITLLIFGGIMWFAFNQQAKIATINAETMKTAKDVLENLPKIIAAANSQQGGSGLIPVA